MQWQELEATVSALLGLDNPKVSPKKADAKRQTKAKAFKLFNFNNEDLMRKLQVIIIVISIMNYWYNWKHIYFLHIFHYYCYLGYSRNYRVYKKCKTH